MSRGNPFGPSTGCSCALCKAELFLPESFYQAKTKSCNLVKAAARSVGKARQQGRWPARLQSTDHLYHTHHYILSSNFNTASDRTPHVIYTIGLVHSRPSVIVLHFPSFPKQSDTTSAAPYVSPDLGHSHQQSGNPSVTMADLEASKINHDNHLLLVRVPFIYLIDNAML